MTQTKLANSVVAKTIKLFIDGEFPRTESGRSYPIFKKSTQTVYANLCLASRKDLRNAVTAAQTAQASWAQRSAYNRSQIIYRMAEILDSRRQEFIDLQTEVQGFTAKVAESEILKSLDLLLHYAGWTDKYSQVMGAVNPVAGPHHNFTNPEAMGTIGILFPESAKLSEVLEELVSVILSGNVAVALLTGPAAIFISALGEVFATSDLPKAVINLLSGSAQELAPQFASHMEIQGLILNFPQTGSAAAAKKKPASASKTSGLTPEFLQSLEHSAVENMKRVFKPLTKSQSSLDKILRTVEYKTVWHPVGI